MTRLDQALVERGLCDSREKAKRFVLAGQVRINGQPARKPSDSIKPTDELALDGVDKFVSRGGHKLEHALAHFQLNVSGLTAIDLGASTGGFTDCLLQRGVEKVFAVDVGQGQLAWKLRQDPRVVVMEKTNARHLQPEHFKSEPVLKPVTASPSPLGEERTGERSQNIIQQSKAVGTSTEPSDPSPSIPLPSEGSGWPDSASQENSGVIVSDSMAVDLTMNSPTGSRRSSLPADLVVIDCSFISLKKILPPAIPLLKPDGKIVALIKPQFEAGKAEVDKGRGVITDAAIHARVLAELEEFVATQAGVCWRGVVESPLLGPAGNKEFLVLIEKLR